VRSSLEKKGEGAQKGTAAKDVICLSEKLRNGEKAAKPEGPKTQGEVRKIKGHSLLTRAAGKRASVLGGKNATRRLIRRAEKEKKGGIAFERGMRSHPAEGEGAGMKINGSM